ncbi:uncharacterized protein LOC142318336 [Lycorma delicatula]|uniref:uncharacterized protein LOC142318336 n=1 Tax=Lycorma delicatula TaxID=130591 RepID=UPI003F50FF31
MPRNLTSSAFMKPFVVLALPGMYLFYKYSQYKRQQQEQNRRKVTERELAHLNHKIDKLLTKLEENEPELATSQEDECVICVNAKATMQTSPCGHRVVCRKCFVKTIQMAVSQRLLPLRCVICRAKILRLKQTAGNSLLIRAASAYSVGSKSWVVPPSASHYSMAHSVPNSESLYSMASGSSSFSGVSSVSSATNSSVGSLGDKGRRIQFPRQPTSGAIRRSQTQAMKYRLQEYKEPVRTDPQDKGPSRLPPIQEFQREFRAGKERSSSTRIRCAQKIVTQLETTHPVSNNSSSNYFRTPLKPPNKEVEKRKKSVEFALVKQKVKDEKRKDDKVTDNKKTNDENIKVITEDSKGSKKSDKREKKEEKKENKKESKGEKSKEEKKELTKAEKKELKKEAKAEKKNAKKEAKSESKKEKSDKKDN